MFIGRGKLPDGVFQEGASVTWGVNMATQWLHNEGPCGGHSAASHRIAILLRPEPFVWGIMFNYTE